VPKHVEGVLIMNCFMNCILLSAFIGQYTIHKKMYKMSNINFVNESPYTTVLVLHLRYIQENQCGDACVTSIYNRNRTLCYFNFPYVYWTACIIVIVEE